jgi:hypothetical protein
VRVARSLPAKERRKNGCRCRHSRRRSRFHGLGWRSPSPRGWRRTDATYLGSFTCNLLRNIFHGGLAQQKKLRGARLDVRSGPLVFKHKQPGQSTPPPWLSPTPPNRFTRSSVLSPLVSRPSHWVNGRNRPTNLSYHHTTPLPFSGSRARPCLAEPKQNNNCLAWRQWRGSDH